MHFSPQSVRMEHAFSAQTVSASPRRPYGSTRPLPRARHHREHRVLLPERGARAGAARSYRVTWPRALGIRLDREQGRRLLERSARVVGGRLCDGCGHALSRVVRQPATVRDARPSPLPRTKPILAVKSGTTSSGARAASSHTAALAGSEAAVDALFRQAGVIRASTLEELIDVATLLSTQPMPRGRRVAVLTNAGGLGILCADACEAAGLELPQLSEDDCSSDRTATAGGGKPRESRRHAGLCIRQLVRKRSAVSARGPRPRCGDRPLRAGSERDGGRGCGCDRPAWGELRMATSPCSQSS